MPADAAPANGHPALLATRRWSSARVRAVATLRHGAGESESPFDHFNLGLRAGDDTEAVLRNRAALARIAALPAPPHWLRQVHGVGVVRVGAAGARPEQEREGDAAVTAAPGAVLAVLTADCLPVVLAAGDGSAVAVAHAGWRGLAGGVLEATVAAMGVAPASLQAWLGPAAGPQAYEVGAEVREAFLRGTGAARSASMDVAAVGQAFVPTRPGHWLCDLYALARLRLAAIGIADVEGGTRCTISEPASFFSHRRDGRSGRMATLAWIA